MSEGGYIDIDGVTAIVPSDDGSINFKMRDMLEMLGIPAAESRYLELWHPELMLDVCDAFFNGFLGNSRFAPRFYSVERRKLGSVIDSMKYVRRSFRQTFDVINLDPDGHCCRDSKVILIAYNG